MKKFVLIFVPFFFVSIQSGFLDEWADNFQNNMHNFGRQLSQDLQKQGKAIEQEARRYAEKAREEERKRQEETKRQHDEIMQTVKEIQDGNIPPGVNSANTTSVSQEVNGRILNIKNTIYSTGNGNKGVLRTVQVIYDGTKVVDWSVNSIIWDGYQLIKRIVQYAPQSGSNRFVNNQSVVINSGSGGVINTGGTSIISTNQGGMIVQEIVL